MITMTNGQTDLGVNPEQETPISEIFDAIKDPKRIDKGGEAVILELGDELVVKLNIAPIPNTVLRELGLDVNVYDKVKLISQEEVRRLANRFPNVYEHFAGKSERLESLNVLNEAIVVNALGNVDFIPKNIPGFFIYRDAKKNNYYVGRVMERIDGVTLSDYVSSGNYLGQNLSIDKFANLSYQLASKYDMLNNRGYVHGDNTPTNKMIDQDGNVVLIDFGGAYKISEKGKILLGVLHHYSPERFDYNIHKNSDQYGLARDIFQLVTGVLPNKFSVEELNEMENSKVEAVRMILKGFTLEDLASKLGDYDFLAPAFARALSTNPDARFGSCTEFVDNLMRELYAARQNQSQSQFIAEQIEQ